MLQNSTPPASPRQTSTPVAPNDGTIQQAQFDCMFAILLWYCTNNNLVTYRINADGTSTVDRGTTPITNYAAALHPVGDAPVISLLIDNFEKNPIIGIESGFSEDTYPVKLQPLDDGTQGAQINYGLALKVVAELSSKLLNLKFIPPAQHTYEPQDICGRDDILGIIPGYTPPTPPLVLRNKA